MVWKFLTTVGKSVAEAAKFVSPQIKYLAEPNLDFSENSALAEKREEIQLQQLKLECLQHPDSLKYPPEIESFSGNIPHQIQAFMQLIENVRNKEKLDFQRWCLEREKAIQLELLKLHHQLQREIVSYQRETSLKVVEEQKRLENSPIWLVAADILNSHAADEIMPLRVFFAPPKLQFERFASAANAVKDFPDIELTLAEGLRQFFRQYSTKGREIDFLAGAWVSKSFHSEASIKALFAVLKSQPTLVLESEVDGNYLNFRIAYWGLNWSKYRYDSVISRLPYRDVLYESAKVRARRWLATRNRLVAAGEKPEDVDKFYGGNNLKNLKTLQKENKFKKAGVETRDLNLEYIVEREDFEELGKFFSLYHCLFAGLVADEYFLVEYNLPPLLPELLPSLMENISDSTAINHMMQAVVFYYQKIYHFLEERRSGWMPELALDLALSLAHLPDKSWARLQAKNSMRSWLKIRGMSPPDGFLALLAAVESVLIIEDVEYVEKLNRCLAAIGEEKRLSAIAACYKRGLNSYKEQHYRSAIADFDRAIELNSEMAEVYYHRGLAYAKLEGYRLAIEDFDRALEIKENWADAWNNRGNVCYKLREYEGAIANYEKALKIQPDFPRATRNLEIARGVLEEIERQQQQEKQRRQQLENFSTARILKGHSQAVRGIAFSPDGETIATASYDETIKLWNWKTGKQLATLAGHSQDVECVAFSPDGKILASGSDDNAIKLWNAKTGEELQTLVGHSGWVRCLAFDRDGQILVSGSDDNTIKLWNLETGEKLGAIAAHDSGVYAIALSADGETLVSGSNDSTIKVWNLRTGENVRTIAGHSDSVWSLAISPDGETLVSGSGDNTIGVWNLRTGERLQALSGHSDKVVSVAISADGERLVSGSGDKTIKVRQLSTGEELATLAGHLGSVWCLAILPDGETLVSGSDDNTIRVWRAE